MLYYYMSEQLARQEQPKGSIALTDVKLEVPRQSWQMEVLEAQRLAEYRTNQTDFSAEDDGVLST